MSWTFNPFTKTFDFTKDPFDADIDVVEASKRLEIEKIANEALAIGDLVKLDDDSSCSKVNVNSYENASVIGICIDTTLSGNAARIQISGIFTDARYSTIAFGAPIFQDGSGQIVQNATTIVGEYFCRVGKSYGSGSIFIRPEEPIEVS